MGKKAVMGTKISKKDRKDDQKHQFQSLIKVLKPKVYITDYSNFKRLVQELTGDGNSNSWSPPSLESTMAEGVFVNENSTVHHRCQYQSSTSTSVETSSGNSSSFNIDDHSRQQQSEHQYHSWDVDVSDSIDASTGSPVSSYTTNSYDQEYDFSYQLQFGADDASLQEYMTKVLDDLSTYQELESFLMDDDTETMTKTTSSLYNLFG